MAPELTRPLSLRENYMMR